MPVSFPSQISPILEIILRANPGTILDIGIGYGIYGRLVAQYFDEDPEKRYRIDGIEPWGEYAGWLDACGDGDRPVAVNWSAYDNVYQGPWPEYGDGWTGYEADPLGGYDLALMIDVLEHYSKEQGAEAVDRLLEKCRAVLVATPKDPSDQERANPYETHRSRWLPSELASAWPAVSIQASRESTIAVLSVHPDVAVYRHPYQRTV